MSNLIQPVRLAFVGFIFGQILALLLGQWIWLDMRLNIAFVVPVLTMLGMVKGLLSKKNHSLKLPITAQVTWVLVFLLIYRSNLAAVGIIPGALIREGFGTDTLSLNQMNWLLIFTLAAGNGAWIITRKS